MPAKIIPKRNKETKSTDNTPLKTNQNTQLYNLNPKFPEEMLPPKINPNFNSKWLNQQIPQKYSNANQTKIENKRKQFEVPLPQTIAQRSRDLSFAITKSYISPDIGLEQYKLQEILEHQILKANECKLASPILNFLDINFSAVALSKHKSNICFHCLYLVEAGGGWWLSGEIYKEQKPIKADLHQMIKTKPSKQFAGYYELIEYEEMFTDNDVVTIMCTSMKKLEHPPVKFVFNS